MPSGGLGLGKPTTFLGLRRPGATVAVELDQVRPPSKWRPRLSCVCKSFACRGGSRRETVVLASTAQNDKNDA